MNLIDELKKIMNALIDHENENFGEYKNIIEQNPEISDETIHFIRKAINELPFEIEFRSCIDFFDGSLTLEDLYDKVSNGNTLVKIRNIFNPIIIYLMDNSYEIKISKIDLPIDSTLTIYNILNHLREIDNSLNANNFEDVTTGCSTVLQSTFKLFLDHYQVVYSKSEKFNILQNKTFEQLKLNVKVYKNAIEKKYQNNPELIKDLLTFISKITSITNSINEIRNIYSNAHGTTPEIQKAFKKLPKHHYQLIVDSTKLTFNFLIGTFEYQNEISNN